MKKTLMIIIPVLVIGGFIGYTFFSSYHAASDPTGVQFVNPQTAREWITRNEAIVVDVQTYDGYMRMHFPNSVPTHAYPVRTQGQIQKVASIAPMLQKSKKPVILVCFGGITGAPNARKILVQAGVPAKRLFVLQGGSRGWPWKHMFISGSGS